MYPPTASDPVTRIFTTSESLLARAQQTIPLGTQTFSKSKTQYPFGVSPYYIQKAAGSRVWDVDGNAYIDFVNALGAITLGYNDPDVLAAVRDQLEVGTIFSLPHAIEIEAAEKLVKLIPCAESVRFGKNGSDATAGAIRLARAITRRDHVAVCGYHGWQDWYIGSTARNLGVPKATQALTHAFQFNQLDTLHTIFNAHPGDVAAVILEPMNVAYPDKGFLEEVQALARQHGALLVFDEMITGFRFENGGAQQRFGVTPDLATIGKGMANGYPISAVVGAEQYMRVMEDIFFSFTFGGEALSLAATVAVCEKLKREPVIDTLKARGNQLMAGLSQKIEAYGLTQVMRVAGDPTWSFLVINDTPHYNQFEIKTLFLQEMFARGMLMLGTHMMSYSHSEADIEALLAAYDEVLPILSEAIQAQTLHKQLRTTPLEPLFKVR